MKNIFILFMLSIMLASYGCAFRAQHNAGGMTAYDGVSNRHRGDAQALAESTAQTLALRYPPGHTSISLVSSPGVFAQALENSLRQKGFVVLPGEQSAAVRVAYILDEIQGEARCYLQVKTSDGGSFGFVRDLTNDPGTPITEPPTVYASAPQEVSIPERPLPMSSSLPVASTSELAAQATLPPYTVRSTATAAKIAKRNKVPVADFCRWNDVENPQNVLHAGHRVYLKEPPAGLTPIASTIPAPVDKPENPLTSQSSPPTHLPLPEPVSLPSRAQTSPALTLEKPKSSEPVPYISVPVTLPVASTVPAHMPPAPSVTPVVTPVIAAPLPEPMPAALPEPKPQWEISKGGMLRNLMEGWAAVAGYNLIWNAQHDYEMQSSATFGGDFIDAVKNFFAALQANGLALRVTIYQGNKVMEVSEH